MFACVPCCLQFERRDEQGQHLRTDYHMYNLKRRIAGLDPISETEFTEVCEHEQPRPVSEREPRPETPPACPTEQDINCTRLKQAAIPYETSMCLFDKSVASNYHESLKYMKNRFSFSLPDEPYCFDTEGMLRLLGSKVYGSFTCLYCDKDFYSLSGVQTHMANAGHRRVGTLYEEQLIEYAPYYDYTTSFREIKLPTHVLEELELMLNEKEWELIDDVLLNDDDWDGDVVTSPSEIHVNKPSRKNDSSAAILRQYAPKVLPNGDLFITLTGNEVANKKRLGHKPYRFAHTPIPSKPPQKIFKITNHETQPVTKEEQRAAKRYLMHQVNKRRKELSLSLKRLNSHRSTRCSQF